ncbi:MAG: hypothetical protein E4H00_03425 [Myxococcales bacterium]|nr:MAG: hypothetical protein E4H00_03425 [Myxococcales bacterium]
MVEDEWEDGEQEAVIDHVSLRVSDLARSTTFYEPVLSKMGFKKLIEMPSTVGFGRKYLELWLNHRPEAP